MREAPRIFISVAEPSADVHAAALVRAVRRRWPGSTIFGLTGPYLRELGVETSYDFAAHAAMLGGVVGVLGHAYRAMRAVQRAWRLRRPDLVILIDSPELHLWLARKARQARIPVLYYIAPQTWAAREYRNRQIVRDVDRLACILPFEEEYFQRAARRCATQGRGFRAQFVGHPLLETLRDERPIAETVEFLKLRAAGRPILALLPGSRQHVVQTLLPMQLEVVRRLRGVGCDVYAAISCASAERRAQIRSILAAELQGVRSNLQGSAGTPPPSTDRIDAGTDLIIDDNASLLTAADLALVASGTATLHVAYHRTPMVVMYDAGRWLYWPQRLLGRYVLRTPHLALVNVLAGARVVPEFMPHIRDLDAVTTVVHQLLTDTGWRRIMVRQLDALVRPLEGSTASEKMWAIIAEMLMGGPIDPTPTRS